MGHFLHLVTSSKNRTWLPAVRFAWVLLLFGPIVSIIHADEAATIWITSDIEGYLSGCDCPSGASAGLSAVAAALEARESSKEPLLDAGGFREPDRSDPLLETYLDKAATEMEYDGMVAVSSDLRDGMTKFRRRGRNLPLGAVSGRGSGFLRDIVLPNAGVMRLTAQRTDGSKAAVAVVQWPSPFERTPDDPPVAAKEFREADFRIICIRGSLDDARTLLDRLPADAGPTDPVVSLFVLTGDRSPAADQSTGGITGNLVHAGGSVPWLSIAPRGNGLARVEFSESSRPGIVVLPLERDRSPVSAWILELSDAFMDELIETALAAAGAVSGPEGIGPDVRATYWYPFGCRDCEDFLWDTVPELERASGGSVEIEERNTADPNDFSDLIQLLDERDVDLRLIPVLVTPDAVLQGDIEIHEGLEALLTGGPDGEPTTGVRSSPVRWEPGAIALAGLLDGINPCAFSAMVFLVSALAVAGRSKRRLIAVGLLYAAGIFVTYTLVGAGLLGGLRRIAVGPVFRRIFEYGLSGILLVLAVMSLIDGFRLSKGRSDLLLRLPSKLSDRVHGLIREEVRAGAAVGGALLLGVMVALIELGCTGQVYLPTIAWMIARGDGVVPWFWLIIYNGAFMVPLLIVFAVSYRGVSAVKLAGLFRRRGSTAKYITAALLTVLAVILMVT